MQLNKLIYQIVNGGQTLVTLANYYRDSNLNTDELSELKVFIKILNTSNSTDLLKISEYTNSQTTITEIDLKSVDLIQKKIEMYLYTQKINYKRKKGVFIVENDFSVTITMEQLAQILYSVIDPTKVTNNKKKLFTDYYEKIFYDNMDFSDMKKQIDLYYEIDNELDDSKARIYVRSDFLDKINEYLLN